MLREHQNPVHGLPFTIRPNDLRFLCDEGAEEPSFYNDLDKLQQDYEARTGEGSSSPTRSPAGGTQSPGAGLSPVASRGSGSPGEKRAAKKTVTVGTSPASSSTSPPRGKKSPEPPRPGPPGVDRATVDAVRDFSKAVIIKAMGARPAAEAAEAFAENAAQQRAARALRRSRLRERKRAFLSNLKKEIDRFETTFPYLDVAHQRFLAVRQHYLNFSVGTQELNYVVGGDGDGFSGGSGGARTGGGGNRGTGGKNRKRKGKSSSAAFSPNLRPSPDPGGGRVCGIFGGGGAEQAAAEVDSTPRFFGACRKRRVVSASPEVAKRSRKKKGGWVGGGREDASTRDAIATTVGIGSPKPSKSATVSAGTGSAAGQASRPNGPERALLHTEVHWDVDFGLDVRVTNCTVLLRSDDQDGMFPWESAACGIKHQDACLAINASALQFTLETAGML